MGRRFPLRTTSPLCPCHRIVAQRSRQAVSFGSSCVAAIASKRMAYIDFFERADSPHVVVPGLLTLSLRMIEKWQKEQLSESQTRGLDSSQTAVTRTCSSTARMLKAACSTNFEKDSACLTMSAVARRVLAPRTCESSSKHWNTGSRGYAPAPGGCR